MNQILVWDPSQVQQILQQPNVQLPNQLGPTVSSVQATPQVSTPGSV